ncbi:serpin-ZX [Rosa sericea]
MASRKGVKRARSPEPPSFTESKKLRKAINNQTRVAMEITEKLLLTEGKEQNMVYSPLSIHVVLSMIAAGTKGLTKDQLLSFLKSKSINELNDLASNVAPLVFADGSPRGGPCLSFANGVWVEQSCPVKPSFKDVVDTAYKAALKLVDFKDDYEQVRCELNSWAEKETKGLIKDIFPHGSVNSKTRLLLANALYFKGAWEKKLSETRTKKYDFHLHSGSSIKATFVTSREDQFVSVFNNFKVLKLPYKQGQDYKRRFSMYVFLPNARDGLPALVKKACTKSGFIDQYIPKHRVHLGYFLLPKFKITSKFNCTEILKTLGLKLPFVPGGLTEMVEGEDPFINTILQKSCIEVNIDGTEAAAVTAGRLATVGAGRGPPKPPPITFVADHPFLFLIREEVTGTVLFVGHVLNPNEEN